jgi:nucleoside phosphorylase
MSGRNELRFYRDVYIYCESAKASDKGYDFEVKHYSPSNFSLQDIASRLKSSDIGDNGTVSPWVNYLRDGLNTLGSQIETDFKPPSVETDKLYMTIGERDLIEVAHPVPQDKTVKRQEGCPRIHLSTIASGRQVVRDDRLRQQFASEVGALAFDCEFDAVIESVLGNCKDSFIIIRGISDYKDGTRRKEWQPYASLAAASVMKAIICGLEPPTNV